MALPRCSFTTVKQKSFAKGPALSSPVPACSSASSAGFLRGGRLWLEMQPPDRIPEMLQRWASTGGEDGRAKSWRAQSGSRPEGAKVPSPSASLPCLPTSPRLLPTAGLNPFPALRWDLFTGFSFWRDFLGLLSPHP